MKQEEQMEVKEGMENNYKRLVANNQDESDNKIIISVAAVGRALTEGKTCEEAIKQLKVCDFSELVFGFAVGLIYRYHKRGEEFENYWNKGYGMYEGKK